MMGRVHHALIGTVLAGCGFTVPQPGVSADAGIDARRDSGDAVFDPAKCPSTFQAITGLPHRYLWGPQVVQPGALRPWRDAQARCASLQASGGYQPHLVVFDSNTERDTVWARIGPDISWAWSWTGVYKRSDGRWGTILGEVVTPGWASGEPNAARQGNGQHALAQGANPQGTFGDLELPIDWGENAICECDGHDVIALP